MAGGWQCVTCVVGSRGKDRLLHLCALELWDHGMGTAGTQWIRAVKYHNLSLTLHRAMLCPFSKFQVAHMVLILILQAEPSPHPLNNISLFPLPPSP